MKNERLEQLKGRDLVTEIDNTRHGSGLYLLGDAVLRAAESVSSEVAELVTRIRHLKEQRASQHPGQSPEDARRRLQNAKLLTPIPADCARSLLILRMQLVEEVMAHVQRLVVPLAKLEEVDAELDATREALLDLERTRELHKSTGLYAGSADFVSRLHVKYQIGWKELEALSEDDERAIADIVLRRV